MAAVIDAEDLRRQTAASPLKTNEEGESTMDEVLKQVVTEIRTTIPHLATKVELRDTIADLKGEVSALRLEMTKEVAAQRDEMKDGLAAANASIAALRGEMKDGFAAANASIATLRNEMKDGFAAVTASVAELDKRIDTLGIRLMRWAIPTIIAAIVAATGVAKLFS